MRRGFADGVRSMGSGMKKAVEAENSTESQEATQSEKIRGRESRDAQRQDARATQDREAEKQNKIRAKCKDYYESKKNADDKNEQLKGEAS